MRLDGDLYESTIEALENFYPKRSIGGCVLVDDYGDKKECRQAVDDFRRLNQVNDEIRWIEWSGVF